MASDATELADAAISHARTIHALGAAAAGCQACPLWRHATQTVFGDGPADARLMLIGEQPGDEEDHQGRPFVGPAGHLLDRALEEAGLDRRAAYVTNAVKHFKHLPAARGSKRRIHDKPNRAEVSACHPWLAAEIALVEPDVIVCLGATAAQALLGSDFRVTRRRGELIPSPLAIAPKAQLTATVHPSSILRARDAEARARELGLFVEDLKVVAALLARH
jgi:DNA polymerase